MHLFLYGPSGAGKTTLINAALRQANIAPAGFSTKKLPLPQSSPTERAPLPPLSQPSCCTGREEATHRVLLGPPDISQPTDDISGGSAASVSGHAAASFGRPANPSPAAFTGSNLANPSPVTSAGSALVGLCGPAGIIAAYPQVFDTAGAALLEGIPPGSLVLMDELGLLEKDAFLFQNRVLEVLDGPYRVLGVIKEKSHPFLDRVKGHRLVQCLAVEAASRRQAAAQLRRFLRQ